MTKSEATLLLLTIVDAEFVIVFPVYFRAIWIPERGAPSRAIVAVVDHGKPMMIGETASCRYYGGCYAPDQPGYIQEIESTLGPLGHYRNIQALLYFDAFGD